ncbi:hypothetical protein ACTFIV_004375 [Dictyostelium citrinum]
MKSILLFLLVLISAQKCLCEDYFYEYYSGYSYDISNKNRTSLNPCKATLHNFDFSMDIPLNCSSTNYSFRTPSDITANYNNFLVVIGNYMDRLYFTLKESIVDTFIYNPDRSSVIVMGLGIQYLEFSNGYSSISCNYHFNQTNEKESMECEYTLLLSCRFIQWHNNFIQGKQYLFADSTINSIELLGSSLLIDADFKCKETILRRGISINNRDSYNSLNKANYYNQTLFTYDPSGYSICLREDEIYDISLISQFGNQTFYSNSVEFSCKQGEILESNAAITLISTIALFSFLLILLIF